MVWRLTVSHQNTNPQSPVYGSFVYPGYEDYPGLEYEMFTPMILMGFYLLHGEELPSTLRDSLHAALLVAADGVYLNFYPHHSDPGLAGHTNYNFMYAAILRLGGELGDDTTLTCAGDVWLADWAAYALNGGITEFLSPTSYAVDWNALQTLGACTESESVRQFCLAWLAYFWADVALNWHPPTYTVAGAHSRDYRPWRSIGSVCTRAALAGWPLPPEISVDDGNVLDAVFPYDPPEELATVFTGRGAGVVQRIWRGDEPWCDAATYFGQGFAIGWQGRERGSQDRPFALLIDEPYGPAVMAWVDMWDNPFELPRIGGGSGHNHEPTGLMAIGNESAALITYDPDPGAYGLERDRRLQ